MSRTKWWIGVVIAFALMAAACGNDSSTTAAEQDTSPDADDSTTEPEEAVAPAGDGYSVAFLLDGFMDDGGWNSTFVRAIEQVRAAYPGLDVQVLEEISPGTTTTNAAEDLGADGVDLVVAAYFSQFDIMPIAEIGRAHV